MKREQYALTNSRDGAKRLNFSIDYRMSVAELACHITASKGETLCLPETDYKPDRLRISLAIPTKRAAIKIASDYIQCDGEDRASYVIGDNNMHDLCDAVASYLVELWGAPLSTD